MKKRVVWLAAFLISLLLSISAFATTRPPQTAGDVPVPAHTVPVVSNVQISGDTITMDVSGTYTLGGVYYTATTPTGEIYMYEHAAKTGTGASVTLAFLPADTLSWTLTAVAVRNEPAPDVGMYFNYDPDGTLKDYSIVQSASSSTYYYDSEGHLNFYFMGSMYVSYDTDGSLTGYSITTPTSSQRYNGKYELVSEQITDPATKSRTELNYKDGVLTTRIFTDADGNEYMYDSQGVLRSSRVTGSDGVITITVYDENGNLNSYQLVDGSVATLYDAEGSLVLKEEFGGPGLTLEIYKNGQVTNKTVSGILPDGRNYEDAYENGVYTRRTIFEEDGAYHYDTDGNYLGKTVYTENGMFISSLLDFFSEYQEFNAQGVLTGYQVYSEQQGGVYLRYNYRRALQSITYLDPYMNNFYRYDPKEKIWYLNEVPYDGPVPIILSELKLEKEIVWYPNNTVCSFGPQFRDIKPDLTDKWYMFTPVDLSKDGTQTFELVGGSVYVLGQVSVTVSGDSVTVNYSTIKGKYGNIYMKSEYLNFFPDLASVKTVEPGELGDGFKFGQALSIQKDLGGDTNVLMFVRNVATFCNFVDKDTLLRRFYKNLPGRADLRDQMLAMMD